MRRCSLRLDVLEALHRAMRVDESSGVTRLTARSARALLDDLRGKNMRSHWETAIATMLPMLHAVEGSGAAVDQRAMRQRALWRSIQVKLFLHADPDNWLAALHTLSATQQQQSHDAPQDQSARQDRVVLFDCLFRHFLLSSSGSWQRAIALACAHSDVRLAATAVKRLASIIPRRELDAVAIRLSEHDARVSAQDTFATAAAQRLGFRTALRWFLEGRRVDVSCCGTLFWHVAERLDWPRKMKTASRLIDEGHHPSASMVASASCALSRDVLHDSLHSQKISPQVLRIAPNDVLAAGGRFDRVVLQHAFGDSTAVFDSFGADWGLTGDAAQVELLMPGGESGPKARAMRRSLFWRGLLDHGCITFHPQRHRGDGEEETVTVATVDLAKAKHCMESIKRGNNLTAATDDHDDGSAPPSPPTAAPPSHSPHHRLPVILSAGDLVVINKPVGVATAADPFHKGESLVSLMHLDGVPRGGVTHRIDVGTSGVVSMARSAEAASVLRAGHRRAAWFQSRPSGSVARRPTLDNPKRYLVLCRDFRSDRTARSGTVSAKLDSLTAVSRFRIHASACDICLCTVDIFTGRNHQVRRHMASIGMPLLNDRRYGGGMCTSPLLRRIAIHAAELTLQDPASGRGIVIIAAPPPDFAAAVSWLRAAEERR